MIHFLLTQPIISYFDMSIEREQNVVEFQIPE